VCKSLGEEPIILKEYLIGTGGWAYFHVPGLSPLVAYSRMFNFVEVNSTFYKILDFMIVEKWRRVVPLDFQFSVRAHRSMTHVHRLQPVDEVFDAFEIMKQTCRALNAGILHLQTPRSFEINEKSADNLRQFLSSIKLGNLRLALEVRGTPSGKLPQEFLKIMQDNGIVHCVDLSKGETPAYDSDILYSRLFGKGHHNIYQPTDDELVEIDSKASNSKSEKIAMSFHFVRMYKDAARLKVYKQTGKFPMVTLSTGIASLEEVLSEDAAFPATKEDLIKKQGWKLFDGTETDRVKVGQYLEKLPDGTYQNASQVAERLASAMR
jgi:uncharacterized protein YecE (DUF72 family)